MLVTQQCGSNLPTNAQVFTDAYADRTLIQENGDLIASLNRLVNKGCNTVLVEAGGTLMASFLRAGLADEVAFFYAPLITGTPIPAIGFLTHDIELTNQTYQRIGNDILLSALVAKDKKESHT